MRKWRSHKIVEAEPITAYQTMQKTVMTDHGIETYCHEVPEDFFARGLPLLDDYLVRYADGYLSWSPKKAFEDGYTLYEDPALDFSIHVSCRGLAFVITEEEIEDGLIHHVFDKNLPALLSPDAMKPRSAAKETLAEKVRSVAHPSETDARDKLVRFLIARIVKFEGGYDSTDALRMEELSWLLLQAVGGQIM